MMISVRHMQKEDVTAVHQIMGQQSVIDGTMRLPYAPIEYAQSRFEQTDGFVRLVAETDKNEVVGFLELMTFLKYPRHNHCAEINFVMVHEKWQNHGVGRQLMDAVIDLAEQWMQIERLSLIVWADNHGAIHLYEQMGFEIEGTMPNYAFRNGRYINAHMMGRLKMVPVDDALAQKQSVQLNSIW
ncbi:MAG: GNAT family N-acetyltransferase [Chloroflexota bacterium]